MNTVDVRLRTATQIHYGTILREDYEHALASGRTITLTDLQAMEARVEQAKQELAARAERARQEARRQRRELAQMAQMQDKLHFWPSQIAFDVHAAYDCRTVERYDFFDHDSVPEACKVDVPTPDELRQMAKQRHLAQLGPTLLALAEQLGGKLPKRPAAPTSYLDEEGNLYWIEKTSMDPAHDARLAQVKPQVAGPKLIRGFVGFALSARPASPCLAEEAAADPDNDGYTYTDLLRVEQGRAPPLLDETLPFGRWLVTARHKQEKPHGNQQRTYLFREAVE